jgi:hypothetical protein
MLAEGRTATLADGAASEGVGEGVMVPVPPHAAATIASKTGTASMRTPWLTGELVILL